MPGMDLTLEEENSSLEDSSHHTLEDGLDSSLNNIFINNDDDSMTENSASVAVTTTLNENPVGLKRKLKYNYSSRKRKCRTTFTKSQLGVLEAEFVKSNFVSSDKIDFIVEQTGLDSRIIKVLIF